MATSASCAPLSASEQRQWSRLADGMDSYHNYFRASYKAIEKQAGSVHNPGDLYDLITEGQSLVHHLHTHHSIEERYIFPILARRMPQFEKTGAHLHEHEEMSRGLDKFAEYLKLCSRKPGEYSPERMKEAMAFGTVLFAHLDDEVRSLSAESLQAAGWSLAELRALPM